MSVRFWAKVDKSGSCWLWIGGTRGERSGKRFGSFKVDGHHRPAHRVAWELANGPLGGGEIVRQTCGEPLCVLHLTTDPEERQAESGPIVPLWSQFDYAPTRVEFMEYRDAS